MHKLTWVTVNTCIHESAKEFIDDFADSTAYVFQIHIHGQTHRHSGKHPYKRADAMIRLDRSQHEYINHPSHLGAKFRGFLGAC